MRDVLAVVVAYRNPHLTLQAVRSLEAQRLKPTIFVWENYSNDSDHDQLARAMKDERHRYKNLWYAPSQDNDLWSPAVNMAVRTFQQLPTYILLANNDITLSPTCLQYLVEAFEQHADAGMMGPQSPRIGGPQNSFYNHKSATYRCTYLEGSCMMIRGAVWKLIGPLDETMPLGADDHDYSIRVKDAGYTIWVEPKAKADHVGHATGKDPIWDDWGEKSWAAFNKKWEGYFYNGREAVQCHWSGTYHPGWDKGTGWLSPELREIVWNERGEPL